MSRSEEEIKKRVIYLVQSIEKETAQPPQNKVDTEKVSKEIQDLVDVAEKKLSSLHEMALRQEKEAAKESEVAVSEQPRKKEITPKKEESVSSSKSELKELNEDSIMTPEEASEHQVQEESEKQKPVKNGKKKTAATKKEEVNEDDQESEIRIGGSCSKSYQDQMDEREED